MYVMYVMYKRIFLRVVVPGFSTCTPIVGYLFVRCFLIFFGGRFGRVSRGTLPILATIHAVLVELQRVLLLYKTFLLFFD